MEKNKLFWVSALITAIVVAAAFIIYYAGGPKGEEPLNKKAVAEQKLLLEKKIGEMVKKHDAVANWDAGFKSREMEEKPIYTVEIQEALLGKGGRPILFYAPLVDIERGWVEYTPNIEKKDPASEILKLLGMKKSKGLIARFETIISPEITFELECSQEQVNRLLKQSGKISENNYAVIAEIKEVFNPGYAVRDGDKGTGMPGNRVARGVCVDFLNIGGFYWEFVH